MMQKVRILLSGIRHLINDDHGGAMAEYVLLVALLALAATGVTRMFQRALRGFYQNVARYRTGAAGMFP